MPRPPRLEYANALYHITSRGARQGAIFLDDQDRASLLSIQARALRACNAWLFAYCLMGNHYHFVLQTRHANLSALMHRINGVYSLTFNRRHGLRGPVFESRFKSLHVDRDNCLLEVCRYVDLNPVRARLAETPAQWAWSSYRAHAGLVPPPRWLATAELHGVLMGQVPANDLQDAEARRRYVDWVDEGGRVRLWKESLRRGIFLGDEKFVERVMQEVR